MSITKTITRIYKSSFESAHFIKDHPKCGKLHGHSYNLELLLDGNDDEWVDFKDIKDSVDSVILNNFDHKNLGDITAEKIVDAIIHFLPNDWHGVLTLFETSKFGVSKEF